MKDKIIEILEEYIHCADECGDTDVIATKKYINECASRIEALGKDKMSAEEWLIENQGEVMDWIEDGKSLNARDVIILLEQYAKYRTT